MKWGLIVGVVAILIVLVFLFNGMTGETIDGKDSGDYGAPSVAESECLRGCVVDEGKEESVCMVECGVEPEPEAASGEESCMQECVKKGCSDERDFNCQRANVDFCEDECGMKGDAPDESEMNEEQRCISKCVAAEDPTMICGSGTEEGMGETGGSLCQKCANKCVELYDGPCLNDEEITQREKDCETCEHCYGALVMGGSGEGYECIVDIKCEDSSGEFGDEAGEGPGIGQEGYVAPNVFLGAIDGVVGFFKGIFGGSGE